MRLCSTVANDLFAHLMPAVTDMVFAVESSSRTERIWFDVAAWVADNKNRALEP